MTDKVDYFVFNYGVKKVTDCSKEEMLAIIGYCRDQIKKQEETISGLKSEIRKLKSSKG